MLPTERVGFALTLCLSVTLVGSYQWPSPQYDALEDMLYTGLDKSGGPIGLLATGCTSRVSSVGPPIGAEWLRLAYHDMATHNVTDGTGGLDASIYYEHDRPENIGDGIIQSLNDFANSANKYVSRADVIAMGAIWGVTACGGPPIAFQGGRIDALTAGRLGVPEPQQDLNAHKESFRLQGFTPTEMISLVACGHAFGGVRNLDFPEIVSSPRGRDESLVEGFDSSIQTYDPKVVIEYLAGTTKNPLVVVTNATLQSDLRIFSSDGNITMKSMDNSSAFNQTCSSLLARMLNTVPATVKLTEEITFIPFKVNRAQITVANNQLVFDVEIRVQHESQSLLQVVLLWCDRRGDSAACSDGQANFANVLFGFPGIGAESPLTIALGITSSSFTFTIPLGSQSIQKFWFEVTDSDGNIVVEDNGGDGYIIEQDTLIALSPLPDLDGFNTGTKCNLIVGILGVTEPTLAQARIVDNSVRIFSSAGSSPPIPLPLNTTVDLEKNMTMNTVAGYQFYTASVDSGSSATADYTVVLDGKSFTVDFMPISSGISDDDGFGLSSVGKRPLSSSGNSSTIPLSISSVRRISNEKGLRSIFVIITCFVICT